MEQKTTTIYLHRSKEENFDTADELELTDEQKEEFKYTASELELEIFVVESGVAYCSAVNGIRLMEPVII